MELHPNPAYKHQPVLRNIHKIYPPTPTLLKFNANAAKKPKQLSFKLQFPISNWAIFAHLNQTTA